MSLRGLVAASLMLAACTGSDGTALTPQSQGATTTAVLPEPVRFHCSLDGACPEVLIDGDSFATLGTGPSPFRGYGDPSLEADADGTLWLAYSWLELVIADPGPPLLADLGVRTHLARSDDDGSSFQFVRAINDLELSAHPDSGILGWTEHEVSTLVRRPGGRWQVAWLDYFDEAGGDVDRSDIRLSSSKAETPQGLGDRVETLLAATPTSPSFPARFEIPAAETICAAFTEPALFSHDGGSYLVLQCTGVAGSQGDSSAERLTLLREGDDGYEVVGNLITGSDAAAFGFDVFTQPDVSVAREGSLLLVVTPKKLEEDPAHQGCIVFTIDDLGTASVRRDGEGVPIARTIITADGNGLGPGLCTYDSASETGVLLVITSVDIASNPVDIVFSLRETGIHP